MTNMENTNPRHILRRGLMMVLSSPSGAGKTTLSKMLMAGDDNIVMSVSATTRPPRRGEIDGRDYYFMSPSAFDEMVAAGKFLEHAQVFDHAYGTPAAAVDEALKDGRDILFDIDWQGTQELAANRPRDLVTLFILPPTMAELERRLKSRGQDSDSVVARRMAKAAQEISHWAEYDYVLINDDLPRCLMRIQTILEAERLKRQRQTGLVDFVRNLDIE